MKWFGLSKDDIPQRVLRVLLALTVVVFMAFFLFCVLIQDCLRFNPNGKRV